MCVRPTLPFFDAISNHQSEPCDEAKGYILFNSRLFIMNHNNDEILLFFRPFIEYEYEILNQHSIFNYIDCFFSEDERKK